MQTDGFAESQWMGNRVCQTGTNQHRGGQREPCAKGWENEGVCLCFALPAHSSILLHVLTQSDIDKLHVLGGRDAGRED